jgi:heme-degrading monooxygenase HmoA
MRQHSNAPPPGPGWRYVYVWEFIVAPQDREKFRAAYGPSGAWSALFSRSSGFLGTLLLQDQANPDRFLTVDRWISMDAHAHDAFIAEARAEYERVDRACETLTQREASLGSFWEVVEEPASTRRADA